MPNIICNQCGGLFFLNRKNFKYVLRGIPTFCSWVCLTDYILNFNPKHHKVKYVENSSTDPTDLVYYPDLGMSFRSKFEYKVALYLKNLGLKYEYEKYILKSHYNGKNVYIPDFYLPTLDLFIEVKGLWNRNSRNKVKYWSNRINLLVIPYYLHKQGD